MPTLFRGWIGLKSRFGILTVTDSQWDLTQNQKGPRTFTLVDEGCGCFLDLRCLHQAVFSVPGQVAFLQGLPLTSTGLVKNILEMKGMLATTILDTFTRKACNKFLGLLCLGTFNLLFSFQIISWKSTDRFPLGKGFIIVGVG